MNSATDKINKLLSDLTDVAESQTVLPAWVPSLFTAFRLILSDFESKTKALEASLTAVESRVSVCETKSTVLCEENIKLRGEVQALKTRMEVAENYSRRNCLLFHGVEESAKENTDAKVIAACKDHLGLDIDVSMIDRSHRLGQKFEGRVTRNNKPRPRPIICKFASYRTRSSVFYIKKKFKDTGISVTESLSEERLALLNRCKVRYGKFNCWTKDANIYVIDDSDMDSDGTPINITCDEDIR